MIKFFLCIACLIPLLLTASDVPPSARESIEWCDTWLPHANETNLPRVLLIGDSITRAYDPAVEKKLAGRAYVARLATSAFLSDPMLLKEITLVLDSEKFDVIQFNNGMHGWQHSEAEYRVAFPEFLATILNHARGAKLIWATTTSLKKSTPARSIESGLAIEKNVDAQKLMLMSDLMRASNERIAARNAIALEFVKRQGIPVDDLNALMTGHPEFYSGNVHFNGKGIAVQADQVAAQIEKLLSDDHETPASTKSH
jgi:hypothetical protein